MVISMRLVVEGRVLLARSGQICLCYRIILLHNRIRHDTRVMRSLGAAVLIVFLLLSACAGGGGGILKIDAQNVPGMRHMPDELNDMLSGLGYRWIPVTYLNAGRGVKTVKRDGNWIMLFEHNQTRQVRIGARIRIRDGYTRLRFHEVDSQALSAPSKDLLKTLQQRAAQQFGPANVSY